MAASGSSAGEGDSKPANLNGGELDKEPSLHSVGQQCDKYKGGWRNESAHFADHPKWRRARVRQGEESSKLGST